MKNFGDKDSFIWSVADLLAGPYKPPQFGRGILPLTVLPQLDCVDASHRAAAVFMTSTMLKGTVVG